MTAISRPWTIARSNGSSAHTASGITTSPRTAESSTSRSSRITANEPAPPTLILTLRSSPSRSCPSGSSRSRKACARAEQREGECLFCEILRRELGSGRRVVAENGAFVALEPFAARFPFETWLLPKVHARAFETLSDPDRGALAPILKDVLGRMYRMLDDPSFNYYIHTAPVREPKGTFHWHLEITPRLTEIAGFERGTGFYINPVVPEDAAAILKGEIRWTGQSI